MQTQETQPYQRFYKCLTQSTDPVSTTGYDGTQIYQTTSGHLWVFKVTSGKNPSGYGVGTWQNITTASSGFSSDGTTAATTQLVTATQTLASNAPTTSLRLLISGLTLTSASGTAVTPSPSSSSFTPIRGVLTLTTGKTFTGGFYYGTQGKLIADGATIVAGSGHVCGLYAQLSLSGSTITSGHVAGLIVSGQNWPGSSGIHGIYVESGQTPASGAVLACVFDGTHVLDLAENNNTNTMCKLTSNLCTTGNGWFAVKIKGTTGYVQVFTTPGV